MTEHEKIALIMLRDAFYDGTSRVSPRALGKRISPTASPAGAGAFGGRIFAALVREGLALRSTYKWDSEKTPHYRITTAGRSVAAKLPATLKACEAQP